MGLTRRGAVKRSARARVFKDRRWGHQGKAPEINAASGSAGADRADGPPLHHADECYTLSRQSTQ